MGNKMLIINTGITVFVAVLALSLSLLIISKMQSDLTAFEKKAREALGTDDFVIEIRELLIARTKDGRQYPSEEFVSEYYRTRMLQYLITLGFGGVLCLSFALWLSHGQKGRKRNEYLENEKERYA